MSTLSVVIPARNAAALLDDCLASLRANATPPPGVDAVELIVVDNDSTDDTAAVARAHGARVVVCARRGQGAARNVGIAIARGDLIACTDADCTVQPGWLAALARAFDDPRVGAVGGCIVPGRTDTLAERHAADRRVLNQDAALAGLPGFLPYVITANAAFRRAALVEAGPFDETIHPAEDADLGWRLAWTGWRLAYAPDAVVRHHHRADLPRYWRQQFGYGVATARLFAKHRHRLGRRRWFQRVHLGDARRSLFRIPGALVGGSTAYERALPMLDLVTQSAALTGRVVGSLRCGVVVL